MKKILIISPHFPPSNLAAVHRSRLFAQHLPSFNYTPIILTVAEKYYEERLDYNLLELVPKDLRIEKVKALPISKPRVIGDIGLRAFYQLYKKAKSIIEGEKISFLYIPIPSFYVALLGRLLHERTGIKYGIDYIDPWVHVFPGSDKFLSRHWLSTKVAKILEPIAVKKASLITGVAAGYYKGVQLRNPHLLNEAVFAAMPYGGEKADYEKVKQLKLKPYLFSADSKAIRLVYAGAMLPKAFTLLEAVFDVIAANSSYYSDVEFHFVGTGKRSGKIEEYSVRGLAEKFGLWKKQVFEYPERISYLDVLIHLQNADGIFILGSTEIHYSPSKVYQGILSGKPIFAILHRESSAVNVIRESNSGVILEFDSKEDLWAIKQAFQEQFKRYRRFLSDFNTSQVDLNFIERFSAKSVSKNLADALSLIK